MITVEELMERLSYSRDTGHFVWKINSSRAKIGSVAGTIDKDGYILIGVLGSTMRAHRIAWAFEHGHFPKLCIDHINRIRSDNRISNLRECSISQNSMNSVSRNPSGVRGVTLDKRTNKWYASIRCKGEYIWIGSFLKKQDAIEARIKKEGQLFGGFSIHAGIDSP